MICYCIIYQILWMLFVAASLTLANHNLMNVYIAKALWQNALLFYEVGTWTSIMKFSMSAVSRYLC